MQRARPWDRPSPTLARPPEPVHPVPQQHDPGQLCEGLDDVEIAQRADLEEGHAQALRVGLGLLCGDLPLEGQVQAVSHQDFRNTGSMLKVQREARKRVTCESFCRGHRGHVGWMACPQIHTDPKLPDVPLFGNGVFTDVAGVSHRASHWCPHKRRTQRRQPSDHRGRGSDVSACPGCRGWSAAPRGQRRREGPSSRALGRSGGPADTLTLDLWP